MCVSAAGQSVTSMNYIAKCSQKHFFVQLNKRKLYILPSVQSELKEWVQMTLDIPPVDSFQWSSCVYRPLVTRPKYPHVIITIPSHELGQGTGRHRCTYRRKKKRSTSKRWSVVEQTKWRPAWDIRTVYNECKKQRKRRVK